MGAHPMTLRELMLSVRRPACTALGAAGCGAMLVKLLPEVQQGVFIGGAARVASLLSGVPAVRMEAGWALPIGGQPVLVTAACSATDFFVMAAALLGWHFSRGLAGRGGAAAAAALATVAAAGVAVFVNALRIIAVAQAHRWVVPHAPEAYGAFLHMLTGVAVFLPALIVLNLFLEIYGRFSAPHGRNQAGR